MRLKHDERGVSNVVVVMLSLVLIVVIAANVVFWSYEMNQFDWERIQESLEIIDVAHVTNFSWFMAESEYRVNIGDWINGTYTETQSIDGQYERFREAWNWWDAKYSHRRQITIENNFESILPIGYSICATVDTASLVSAGKTLSSGDDFRIVYWSGSNWTELHRDVIDMNTTSTKIWFRSQAVIDASPATDSNYYVYYGNPSAIDPLANKSNVYVWFDDFSTDTLDSYDKAKWVDIHGSADQYVPPTYDADNERVWFDTGDNYASDMYPKGVLETDFLMEFDFWANGSYPSDATIALVGRLENPGITSTHYYVDFSHGTYDSPGITVDSWVTGEGSNTVYSESSDYYWNLNTVHTLRYAIFGDTQKFWWNKDVSQSPDINVNNSLHTASGRIGMVPAQVSGWLDNLKIRKYVEPEPSVLLELEESQDLHYHLHITGDFIIDVSMTPLASIQTIEIQLVFRANDTLENWYLKAYNWTSMTFSDSGFNNTSGHTPTTDWDTYAVNMTSKWPGYVSDNGTVRVKLADFQEDVNQTTIDIDYMAVKILAESTRFTLKNNGPLTSHLVSIWIINSTDHRRYDANIFINSGDTVTYTHSDINLPSKPFKIKIITEKGNAEIFTSQ